MKITNKILIRYIYNLEMGIIGMLVAYINGV